MVVAVFVLLTAVALLPAESAAVKDPLTIELCVAESLAMLLLIMLLICLIAELVSLIAWRPIQRRRLTNRISVANLDVLDTLPRT